MEATATVASQEEIETFNSLPDSEKKVTESLRGVLAETATTSIVRYEWSILRPLVWHLLEQTLIEFDAETEIEIGPPLPLPNADSLQKLRKRFKKLLDGFTDSPPFTLQRLCELVLQPRKQYTRVDKLAVAIDKLLAVTTTIDVTTDPPPLPLLSSLLPVNDNVPQASTSGQASASMPEVASSSMVNGLDSTLATTDMALEHSLSTVEDQGMLNNFLHPMDTDLEPTAAPAVDDSLAITPALVD